MPLIRVHEFLVFDPCLSTYSQNKGDRKFQSELGSSTGTVRPLTETICFGFGRCYSVTLRVREKL